MDPSIVAIKIFTIRARMKVYTTILVPTMIYGAKVWWVHEIRAKYLGNYKH
jgi:hypothetical protein